MYLAGWIEDLFSTFSDATFYFMMAAVGSLLFSVRLGLMLFGGADGISDHDLHADAGLEGHGGDFSLFSMISVLSFMMGTGWLGLAARLDWHLGALLTAIYASIFGFGLMSLSSFCLWQMRKLSKPGRWDVQHAVGHIGTVYMRIPAHGHGRGQVEISVDGTRRVIEAVTPGEPIESFVSVKVLSVQDDGALVVDRA